VNVESDFFQRHLTVDPMRTVTHRENLLTVRNVRVVLKALERHPDYEQAVASTLGALGSLLTDLPSADVPGYGALVIPEIGALMDPHFENETIFSNIVVVVKNLLGHGASVR
jgi:hypothetical protein